MTTVLTEHTAWERYQAGLDDAAALRIKARQVESDARRTWREWQLDDHPPTQERY